MVGGYSVISIRFNEDVFGIPQRERETWKCDGDCHVTSYASAW